MDITELNTLSKQAFSLVKEKQQYDHEAALNAPLLSTARHRLKGLLGLVKSIIEMYEKLVEANENKNSDIAPIYHTFLKRILEGYNVDFKGVRSNLKMFFYIREFKEDIQKKKATAEYLVILFNLIENKVKKINSDKLEIIRNIDEDYAKYYDSTYIFELLREVPTEVLNE